MVYGMPSAVAIPKIHAQLMEVMQQLDEREAELNTTQVRDAAVCFIDVACVRYSFTAVPLTALTAVPLPAMSLHILCLHSMAICSVE